MVSGTHCPYVNVCVCVVVVRGAAAPKGPMTYAVFIVFGWINIVFFLQKDESMKNHFSYVFLITSL